MSGANGTGSTSAVPGGNPTASTFWGRFTGYFTAGARPPVDDGAIVCEVEPQADRNKLFGQGGAQPKSKIRIFYGRMEGTTNPEATVYFDDDKTHYVRLTPDTGGLLSVTRFGAPAKDSFWSNFNALLPPQWTQVLMTPRLGAAGFSCHGAVQGHSADDLKQWAENNHNIPNSSDAERLAVIATVIAALRGSKDNAAIGAAAKILQTMSNREHGVIDNPFWKVLTWGELSTVVTLCEAGAVKVRYDDPQAAQAFKDASSALTHALDCMTSARCTLHDTANHLVERPQSPIPTHEGRDYRRGTDGFVTPSRTTQEAPGAIVDQLLPYFMAQLPGIAADPKAQQRIVEIMSQPQNARAMLILFSGCWGSAACQGQIVRVAPEFAAALCALPNTLKMVCAQPKTTPAETDGGQTSSDSAGTDGGPTP